MKLWRNPEIKKLVIWLVLAAGCFTVGGFFICPAAGLLVLGLGLLLLTIFLAFTAKRYRDIAELSETIEQILQGEHLLISDSSEGELSILRTQLYKVTVRLQEQADKLQTEKNKLSNALADISHQLRTPLTSMNLTVSLLRKSDISAERRTVLLRELTQGLTRIDWLVEALLKISKLDAGSVTFAKEQVSVRKLIEKSCENFLIPMELRGQELKLNLEEEQFEGDMIWTCEAVSNLMKNCYEHTPEGGCITISAQETPLYTQISVSDTGPGLNQTDIPHLFDRFYKGKDASEESVGIGLALARMIVTAQNGTIRAANMPGGGALFTIRFYKTVV